MSRIIIRPFSTPFGELLVGSYEQALCLCDWRYRRMRTTNDGRIQRGLGTSFVEGTSPVIETAMEQLEAYFTGARKDFDIPVRMVGTEFQLRVWDALVALPYGSTLSYAALTERVAERTAIRAVASANGANAISIIVPCHRVIGSSGELMGYAGGIPTKRSLLRLEAGIGADRADLFSALNEEAQ